MPTLEQTMIDCENARVLLFFDEEEKVFVAHALEFDLVATGETEEEAKSNLLETIQEQIEFAASRSNPGLILHEAPRRFFEEWESARKSNLLNFFAEVTVHRPNGDSPRAPHALEIPLSKLIPA